MATAQVRARSRGAARVVAVVAPCVVAAVLGAVGDAITTATSALVLVLVVVGIGAAGDRLAGLLAAVSSAVWFDFFLTAPTYRFAISDPDDIEVFVLLVLVGIAVTEIALWGLRQQADAARQAGFLDGVMESADLAAGEDVSPDEARRRVASHITALLGVDRCSWQPGPVPARAVAVLRRDGTVEREGQPVPVEREGLPTDIEVALPVRGAGGSGGHFRIIAASRVARPTLQQRRVAVLLADQCSTLVPHPGAPSPAGGTAATQIEDAAP